MIHLTIVTPERKLVDRQVDYMGRALALKALPRTACYFAKFHPGFDDFRAAIHRVRDLRELKPLVLSHFR